MKTIFCSRVDVHVPDRKSYIGGSVDKTLYKPYSRAKRIVLHTPRLIFENFLVFPVKGMRVVLVSWTYSCNGRAFNFLSSCNSNAGLFYPLEEPEIK